MLCIATHLRQFFTFLCPSAGYLATQLLVVNGKIKKFMLLNPVPSNFFDSFAPLLVLLLLFILF